MLTQLSKIPTDGMNLWHSRDGWTVEIPEAWGQDLASTYVLCPCT